MKKQKTQLIVMLILLIVIVSAFFGIKNYNANRSENEILYSEPEYTVLELAYEDVTKFSFTNEFGSYSFERVSAGESGNDESEDVWSYLGDTSFGLDANKISSLLDNVLFIQADTRIEDVSDREQYGLTDEASASITTNSGENYKLLFGDYNEMTASYYLGIDGEPYVYIMNYDIGADFLITPDELMADEVEDAENAEETAE